MNLASSHLSIQNSNYTESLFFLISSFCSNRKFSFIPNRYDDEDKESGFKIILVNSREIDYEYLNMKFQISIQRSDGTMNRIFGFDYGWDGIDFTGYGYETEEFLKIEDIFNEKNQYIDKNATITFVMFVRNYSMRFINLFIQLKIPFKMTLTEYDQDSSSSDDEKTPEVFKDAVASYFNNDNCSDCSIVCSDSVHLPAHRFIIAVRCPAIHALLTESSSFQLAVNDFDSATMLEILRYIYTGKVQNLDKLLFQIFIAAKKYGLKELKVFCFSKLIKQMSQTNVFDTLILADQHNAKKLEKECLDFINM
jgi:hypothetical protein